MHSYYHFGLLVHNYFPMGYLSNLSRTILARFSREYGDRSQGFLFVIPRSEKMEMKPPYVCPGCSNHTYINNMINMCHVR
jgi:hypothetical protein